MAIARFLDRMCLALRASGLWLRYATLQNLIPSFPWIAPPRPPPWRNPRKGRDQILPSGNPDSHTNFDSDSPEDLVGAAVPLDGVEVVVLQVEGAVEGDVGAAGGRLGDRQTQVAQAARRN